MDVSVERIQEFNTELIEKLTEIEAEPFGDGGLNRWTFPVFIRHGAVYVLKHEGSICGVADIIRDWSNPGLAFLVNFVVIKNKRGCGLGTLFLNAVIDTLHNEGVRRVQLTVDPKNERATWVYKRAAFHEVAYLSEEYGPGDDRLLLERELEQ
ncbi:MAG TPA: GNAT family N-acetyltransferase [Candidatus Aquicultor sp.]|jgi:ribosomal-protein-alanine N-acetyltransferase